MSTSPMRVLIETSHKVNALAWPWLILDATYLWPTALESPVVLGYLSSHQQGGMRGNTANSGVAAPETEGTVNFP